MKNNFKIERDIVYIELNRRDGSKLYTMVDLDDLPKLMEFKYKWRAYYDKDTKSFYCTAHIYRNKKRTTIRLHRFIMNPPENLQIDHINNNTLNNRKCNLRIVTNQENQFNCKHTKGYYWNKREKNGVLKLV